MTGRDFACKRWLRKDGPYQRGFQDGMLCALAGLFVALLIAAVAQ